MPAAFCYLILCFGDLRTILSHFPRMQIYLGPVVSKATRRNCLVERPSVGSLLLHLLLISEVRHHHTPLANRGHIASCSNRAKSSVSDSLWVCRDVTRESREGLVWSSSQELNIPIATVRMHSDMT